MCIRASKSGDNNTLGKRPSLPVEIIDLFWRGKATDRGLAAVPVRVDAHAADFETEQVPNDGMPGFVIRSD